MSVGSSREVVDLGGFWWGKRLRGQVRVAPKACDVVCHNLESPNGQTAVSKKDEMRSGIATHGIFGQLDRNESFGIISGSAFKESKVHFCYNCRVYYQRVASGVLRLRPGSIQISPLSRGTIILHSLC